MPCLNLSTNVNLDAIDTSSILSETTSTVAKLIGKPEAYVMIVLKGSIPIAFGGTEQPAAYGELVSIGGLNSDVNKKLSAAVAEILETKLSIPKSRFFLKFYDTKCFWINGFENIYEKMTEKLGKWKALSLDGMGLPSKLVRNFICD